MVFQPAPSIKVCLSVQGNRLLIDPFRSNMLSPSHDKMDFNLSKSYLCLHLSLYLISVFSASHHYLSKTTYQDVHLLHDCYCISSDSYTWGSLYKLADDSFARRFLGVTRRSFKRLITEPTCRCQRSFQPT